MGLFGPPRTPRNADAHERAHARASRALGVPYRWVNRKGVPVIEGRISSGKRGARKGAITLAAGASAGGGDSDGDRKAVRRLARQAGMSEQEVYREARKYR